MNNYDEVLESFYKNTGTTPDTIVCKKWGNKPKVTLNEFNLQLFSRNCPMEEVATVFSRSGINFNLALKKLFPEASLRGRRGWRWWIINQAGYNMCHTCLHAKLPVDFHTNRSFSSGIGSKCKTCCSDYAKNNRPDNRARSSLYRAQKLSATPIWANLEKIREIYLNCPEGYEVDHIHPLQGAIICGLHVENNLQYLPKRENRKKGNKFSWEDQK